MRYEYFKLALTNLKRRGLRSWLTMLGIFIGIAAVVALISLGQGLEAAVASQFQALGADRITVQAQGAGFGPPGTGAANPLTVDDLRIVQNTRGVEQAAGRQIEQLLVSDGETQIVGIVGSYPTARAERNLVDTYFESDVLVGRDLEINDRGVVVLGINYFEREVLSAQVRPRDTITIQGEEFRVVGVYERTGSFQTDTTIAMNENDLRDLLDDDEDIYSVVFAQVTNVDEINQVVENIRENLRRDRGQDVGDEDFQVQTTQDSIDSINAVLGIVTVFIAGIAGISLLVGGIGIMNTMYTSVLERRKEIGVMKSVGARNNEILSIFLFEAGLLGLFGGLIGVALGVGVAYLVEIIATTVFGTGIVQASYSVPVLVGALLFSFVVGVISGYFPARNGARLNPVDAMRS